MDLFYLLKVVVLGIVEGLTEFLPVSSTGHLILVGEWIKFESAGSKIFDVVIQLGAILAVCWIYRAKLAGVAVGIFNDVEDQRFATNLILAFLPAMVMGALLHGFIKSVLFSPWVVSVALIVGGFAIMVIEKAVTRSDHHAIEEMPARVAFGIGVCQTLALIPGVSRAGATIMGAMCLGVDRRTATEFSFFLAIPTMFAATVYDLYKSWSVMTTDNLSLIAWGFVCAFLAAMFVVRTLIGFVSRRGFIPFAWYRIVIGLVMMAILLAR